MHTLRSYPAGTPAKLRILPDGKHLCLAEDNEMWAVNGLHHIFPHEEFSPSYLPLLKNRPAGKQIAIDCGAFIGDHSYSFVGHGLDTWAIEPFFDAFVCLCYNSPYSHNIHGAVGDGRPVSLVHECRGTNHGMRSVKADKAGELTIRLDDLKLPRVDLLKIDVEGCEEWVLDGAMEIIKAFHPVILIESFDFALRPHGSSHESLEAKLRSLGCKLTMLGQFIGRGKIDTPKFDWICHWP